MFADECGAGDIPSRRGGHPRDKKHRKDRRVKTLEERESDSKKSLRGDLRSVDRGLLMSVPFFRYTFPICTSGAESFTQHHLRSPEGAP